MNSQISSFLGIASIFALSLIGDQSACAALPIDVEVVTAANVPITAPQQWARMLATMDLGRVRIRGGNTGDKLGIEQDRQRYKVVALLTSDGELVIEGRRYRASDRRKLAEFFKALAEEESLGEEKGAFGLTQKEFGHVFADLSRPVTFSTAGQDRAIVVEKIIQSLSQPLETDLNLSRTLRRSKPVEWELQQMSAGTSLAIVLREADFVLRPEKPRGEAPQLVIERAEPKSEAWPVGWKIEGSPRKVAPKMFEFLTVEIDGYTLDQALNALEPRMDVPLILDRRTLLRREIDPKKVKVKLLPTKSYLKSSIDKLLSQARLTSELRVDERGKAFCWVTQYGKDSPRAK